ncbi:MAG: hypothetical protein H7Y02_05625 [Candidatus Obscuribacterales bacterium]|nr:hypothetical protein [Steroidobacteraceae bacterium]
MGEQAPHKTGQLVVRYHAPRRSRVLWVLGVLSCALALYLTYEWGRFDGGYSVLAMSQERRDYAAKIAALERDTASLRTNVAGAETAREVEHKSYANVEQSLSALQKQVQTQKEELAFYRGIVAPEDGVGGLRVQRLEVHNGSAVGHYVLRLVIMQSMRQESTISGGVKIELIGTRAQQPTRIGLSDLNAEVRESGELPFSFRYFQKLEAEVTVPQDFEPASVEVAVRSSRQPLLQQTFPWQVISAG